MNSIFAIAGVVIKDLYRRKDFYVLLVLTAVISIALASIRFFNDPNIIRYVQEICLLLIWISSLVICIMTASRQIPAERENRTIFPLLAKPVTRWHVIVGKFLGCWLACGIALVVFYLFFAAMTEIRGHGSAAPTAVAAASAHDHDAHDAHDHDESASVSPIVNYVQALWLHWMMLGVVTAMVIFGSVVFTAPSSNATINFIVVLGILYLGGYLHKVALRLAEPTQTILSAIYFAIPHLEWYDIRDRVIYNHPAVAWSACGLATLYAAMYVMAFLVAGWMTFRRKALSV